jgi:uncharacterized BrkB/YihY/UPF0761 family membrane protein
VDSSLDVVWVTFSASVLLFGAELTKVLAKRRRQFDRSPSA